MPLSLPHQRSEAPEQSAETTFPDAQHLTWNLDEFAELHPPTKDHTLPPWIQTLTQADTSRLLQGIDHVNKYSSATRRSAFTSLLGKNAPFLSDTTTATLIETLSRSSSVVVADLRAWIQRHGHDEFPETEKLYVKKPGIIRTKEHTLLEENLLAIINQHFDHTEKPQQQRTLLDVGAWDGGVTREISESFGHIVAVEPDEKRFQQLFTRAPVTWETHQATMEEMMRSPDRFSFTPDCTLLSQVLYFVEDPEESLRWVHEHMATNGIAIAVMNDEDSSDPCTRAGMRRLLHGGANKPIARNCIQFLEERGIQVRSMKPEIRVSAKSPEGKEALRELLQFQLANESRHDLRAIEEYMALLESRGGVYRHPLHMFVMYQNPETAPRNKEENGYSHGANFLSLSQLRRRELGIDQKETHREPEQFPELPTFNKLTATVGEAVETILEIQRRSAYGACWQRLQAALEQVKWHRWEWTRHQKLLEESPSLAADLPFREWLRSVIERENAGARKPRRSWKWKKHKNGVEDKHSSFLAELQAAEGNGQMSDTAYVMSKYPANHEADEETNRKLVTNLQASIVAILQTCSSSHSLQGITLDAIDEILQKSRNTQHQKYFTVRMGDREAKKRLQACGEQARKLWDADEGSNSHEQESNVATRFRQEPFSTQFIGKVREIGNLHHRELSEKSGSSDVDEKGQRFMQEWDAVENLSRNLQEQWEELMSSNLRRIKAIAKRYQRNGMPLSELIDAGGVGLLRGAELFRETAGVQFYSYAFWRIRLAVQRANREQLALKFFMSGTALESRRQIYNFSGAFSAERGRDPTIEEIAEGTGFPIVQVHNLLRAKKMHVSLDAPVTHDGDEEDTLSSFVADGKAIEHAGVEQISSQELRGRLLRALCMLDPLGRAVLILRNGLGVRELPRSALYPLLRFSRNDNMSDVALTVRETAQLLGMTHARVEQIEYESHDTIAQLNHPYHLGLRSQRFAHPTAVRDSVRPAEFMWEVEEGQSDILPVTAKSSNVRKFISLREFCDLRTTKRFANKGIYIAGDLHGISVEEMQCISKTYTPAILNALRTLGIPHPGDPGSDAPGINGVPQKNENGQDVFFARTNAISHDCVNRITLKGATENALIFEPIDAESAEFIVERIHGVSDADYQRLPEAKKVAFAWYSKLAKDGENFLNAG